jgi:hypothetical protein
MPRPACPETGVASGPIYEDRYADAHRAKLAVDADIIQDAAAEFLGRTLSTNGQTIRDSTAALGSA